MIGGQGWPWRTENQIGPSYGYASAEGYLPDWRSDNDDGYALPPPPPEGAGAAINNGPAALPHRTGGGEARDAG